MKYLYYYIWLGIAKGGYKLIRKPVFKLIIRVKRLYILRIKKQGEEEVQKEIKRMKTEINSNNYDFPDGVTHWHAFGFTLAIVMTMFLFIPLFTIDFFGDYIINSVVKCFIYNIILAVILWYIIYTKKSNKEWLKKKINKKAKEFYL